MSFPVIEETAESSVNTAGTSHAVTLPSGIAATDLVLIIMDIGSTAAALNALTDWSEILDENVANGLKILWYTGAGVPSNPTFTSSASTRSASIAYRISSADKGVTPQIGTTATGTSATPDPPASAAPPSTKDYLFIAFFGAAGEEADDDTWSDTPPTNYTPTPPLQKACGTAGTNLGGMIAAASRQLNTGSAENPGTFAKDVSAAWRAQTITVHGVPGQTINGGVATEDDSVPAGTVLRGANLGAAIYRSGASRVDRTMLGRRQRPFMRTGFVPAGVAQTISGEVATELDAAPAGSVSNPATIAGGVGTESDSALAASIIQPQAPISGGVATESDSVPAGSTSNQTTVSGGASTESDSVPAGTPSNPVTITGGVATESDSVPAGTSSNPTAVSGGVAAESDSVPAGSLPSSAVGVQASVRLARPQARRSRLVALRGRRGPALMAFGAIVQSAAQTINGGVATESDFVPGGSVVQPQAPISGGVATENDSTPAGSTVGGPATVQGGVATESDSVPAAGRAITSGVAREDDSAPAAARSITSGVAMESDVVPAGTVSNETVVFGGTASETNTAPSGTTIVPTIVAGGVAIEGDSVPAGTVSTFRLPDDRQPTTVRPLERNTLVSTSTRQTFARVVVKPANYVKTEQRERLASPTARSTSAVVQGKPDTFAGTERRSTTVETDDRSTIAKPPDRSTTVTVEP